VCARYSNPYTSVRSHTPSDSRAADNPATDAVWLSLSSVTASRPRRSSDGSDGSGGAARYTAEQRRAAAVIQVAVRRHLAVVALFHLRQRQASARLDGAARRVQCVYRGWRAREHGTTYRYLVFRICASFIQRRWRIFLARRAAKQLRRQIHKVCASVCACVPLRAFPCVCVCAHSCVRACVCVSALFVSLHASECDVCAGA
jgi:hypothetical protein